MTRLWILPSIQGTSRQTLVSIRGLVGAKASSLKAHLTDLEILLELVKYGRNLRNVAPLRDMIGLCSHTT